MKMKLESGKYFGETLRSFATAGLVLTEKVHLPGERLPEHFHENAYFCLALEGGWSETAEGSSFHCGVSNVVYHPEEEIHQTVFASEQHSKTFNVEITPSWFEKVTSWSREPLAKRIVSKNFSLTGHLSKIYAEFQRNDPFSPMAIESHFTELFIHLSRRNDKPAKKRMRLPEVKEVLGNTYANPLPLTELAGMFGVHPVYLSKSFRKTFGLTITDYYRNCRIEAACRLLEDTHVSLVEIALECGFYDQSHFGKYFQASTGMSPLAYRKRQAEQVHSSVLKRQST
jgi:AraC family transcriptional regulator